MDNFIELIMEDEKRTLKINDNVEIYYRRVPPDIKARFKDELNFSRVSLEDKSEKVYHNWQTYFLKCLTYSVIGWKGVRVSNKEIPFDSSLVVKLPQEIIDRIQKENGVYSSEEKEENVLDFEKK